MPVSACARSGSVGLLTNKCAIVVSHNASEDLSVKYLTLRDT